HPRCLWAARSGGRGHGQLDDVGRRLRDRLADRAAGDYDAGTELKSEANQSHFESFGRTTFSGGPPISAPAGERLRVSDNVRKLLAVTRKSWRIVRTSY